MKRECWDMGKAATSNTMGREASQEELVSEHRFDTHGDVSNESSWRAQLRALGQGRPAVLEQSGAGEAGTL